MRDLTLEELASLAADLKSLNESRGFEAHPFKIGWYNQSVAEKFELPYSSETLAFVIISQPSTPNTRHIQTVPMSSVAA